MEDLYRLEMGNHDYRKNLGGTFGPRTVLPGATALELAAVRFLDLHGDARPEMVRIVDDTWRYSRLVNGSWITIGTWPDAENGHPDRGSFPVLAWSACRRPTLGRVGSARPGSAWVGLVGVTIVQRQVAWRPPDLFIRTSSAPAAQPLFGPRCRCYHGAMRATWGLIAVAVGCGGASGGDSLDSLVIDRDDVDLGAVAVGQREEATFVVRNTGSEDAGPLETGLSGSSSFAIAASTCTGILAPSATCDVTVEFGPTQVGAEQAMLSIEGRGVVVESQLAGTGVVEVTVVMPSGAPGRIVSDPPGIDCPGTCSAMLSATEAKLQLARGGLWFAGWSAPCGANDLCRLALSDQPLTVETMFLDGYETTAVEDVAAIELSADGSVFLALTDWVGKLGKDGEVVKYTYSGWSGAEYVATALDGDDFLAAGRSNDTDTAFRAMGSRYDADLTGAGSWAGLLVDGNSKATVTTASGEETALTAGIWSGEATPKVFVAKNGRIYIDDTGLDEAQGLVRMPGGEVRLAASSANGQFVQVLDANLERVDNLPLAWDAAAFSADGTLVGVEVDGDSLAVSKWSTAGDATWTTPVDVAVAPTALFVEVDGLSIVIAGAAPEEAADGFTIQVVRLDHDGEVQWTDSLSGLPGLFGLATNAAGDIALLTGEAAGRTVLGYVR